MVAGPLEQLQLMERLDMALVSKNCWPNRSGAASSALFVLLTRAFPIPIHRN
jgi:hypothetical protein